MISCRKNPVAEDITVDDVVDYTNGRLEDNDETQRMLDAALAAARRDVGWHVSPVIEGDVKTLDGPQSRVLPLPTKRLLNLISVVEDGVNLDLAGLRWTAVPDYVARVRKRSDAYWSCNYASEVVTMDHGYTKAEAGDWVQAILTMVDQMSLLPVGGASGRSNADLIRKQVDDVEYQWGNVIMSMAEQSLFSVSHVLAQYRLPPVEYM